MKKRKENTLTQTLGEEKIRNEPHLLIQIRNLKGTSLLEYVIQQGEKGPIQTTSLETFASRIHTTQQPPTADNGSLFISQAYQQTAQFISNQPRLSIDW